MLQPAHTQRMSIAAARPFVNRAFAHSHDFQWVREVLVNSIQAAATKIMFTTEWQCVQNFGVHRRMIIDDGPGISGDLIRGFLNKFGGSGKTVGEVDENFGVGFKTSILPWNKHGVVVISKTATGEMNMMWLHFDKKINDYGARMFDIDSEDGLPSDVVPLHEFEDFEVDGIDWTKVFPADQKTGFAVVLLGNTGTEHTVQGVEGRNENKKYGIIQYINSRFWEVPIEVYVEQYENWTDPTTWPTRPKATRAKGTRAKGTRTASEIQQGRHAVGLQAILATNFTPTKKHPARGIEAKGEFKIAACASSPAATIEWILCSAETDQRGDIVTLPITGILHEAHPGIVEVFDMASMGMEVDTVTAKTRMGHFVKTQSVRDRMILIIKPETSRRTSIFPNQERTKIRWATQTSAGMDMPWDYWQECWNLKTPDAIRKAIAAHYASLRAQSQDGMTDEDYRRLGSRYGDLIKRIYSTTPMLSKRATGAGRRRRKPTDVTDSPENPSKAKQNPDDDNVTPLRKPRHYNVGLIKVIAEALPDGEAFVSYDKHQCQSILNTAHPRYTRMMEMIVEACVAEGKMSPTDDNQRGIVEAEVQRASQMHISLAVSDAVAEAAAFPDRAESILSDESLSSCMRGIRHIETLAAGAIGQALSGNKKIRNRKAA